MLFSDHASAVMSRKAGCVSFFCKEEGDGRIKKKEEEMGK
jgi:hypothetical protein